MIKKKTGNLDKTKFSKSYKVKSANESLVSCCSSHTPSKQFDSLFWNYLCDWESANICFYTPKCHDFTAPKIFNFIFFSNIIYSTFLFFVIKNTYSLKFSPSFHKTVFRISNFSSPIIFNLAQSFLTFSFCAPLFEKNYCILYSFFWQSTFINTQLIL